MVMAHGWAHDIWAKEIESMGLGGHRHSMCCAENMRLSSSFLISRGEPGASRAVNIEKGRIEEERKTNFLLYGLSFWIKLLLR